MKKRLICNIHDEIFALADEISMMNLDSLSKKDKNLIMKNIHKIIMDAGEAKDRGITMEKRLKEYYTAIWGLGFERDKRKQ